MSASREKKSRQNDPTQGLTQKQRKELEEQQAAKRKAVLYTVIGIITAVLVAILLIWHSGIFQRKATAVSVGNHNYTATDVAYYYQAAMTKYYIDSGASFDPQSDLKTQYVDEEQTKSYHDLFLEQAMETLKKTAALEDAAAEAGYTLTDEDKAAVEEQIAATKKSAQQYGRDYASYLKLNYGMYMTPSAYKTCLEREVLVVSYSNSKAESLSVTDEEIEAYYGEHKDDLDTFEYRYVFVDGTAPKSTDADGNTVEPTEAETQAAMDSAKAKANQFLTALQAAEDKEAAFVELAPDYVAENRKDTYTEDPEASHYTTVGSSLTTTIGEWLKNADRKPGDVDVVESSSGYYVMLFLNRTLDESATADIRHILVKAEVADADNPDTTDVDESKVPSQEALDAAKAEAESLMTQWENGDKTAESFGELASANSDDPGSKDNGGLYQNVAEGQMFEGFNDWIMDPSRQPGDVTLIENPQNGQQGWHVVYFQDWADPVWKVAASNSLKSQQMDEWLTSLTEGLEATQADGIKYVG